MRIFVDAVACPSIIELGRDARAVELLCECAWSGHQAGRYIMSMTNVANADRAVHLSVGSPIQGSRGIPSVPVDQRNRIGRQYQQPNASHPAQIDRTIVGGIERAVEVSPRSVVARRALAAAGMVAELVQATEAERIKSYFRGSVHLLVVGLQGTRVCGETAIDGLMPSALRETGRKLTFVPAGHAYRDWQQPRILPRTLYVYFDPTKLVVDPLRLSERLLTPRLFFENGALWETALKLSALIDESSSRNQLYFEALGAVLAHELVRLNEGVTAAEPPVKGGLAGWQQRTIIEYIEEHLSEQVPLSTLAQLVRLNPNYFCRAFKQCFGMPPHRYHGSRRIERAKALLAKPACSVTDIGLELGFNDTSAFSRAFRKATGQKPTDYRRALR